MQGEPSVRAIVVLGVSGCGKTTVGKALAVAIGARFLEGDDYHSEANIAKMRAGTPLTDADRWPWLDAVGTAIAAQTAQGRSVVASCSALRRVYREALGTASRQNLTFIHLTVGPALLKTRLEKRENHFMPSSLLQSQFATLEPLAPDETGTEIVEVGTVEQTVVSIEEWLHSHVP